MKPSTKIYEIATEMMRLKSQENVPDDGAMIRAILSYLDEEVYGK